MGGRVFVGYIFMTENMRVKDAAKVTSAMFTIDSFTILIAAMYFMHVSKDWIYIFGIALFLQALSIIMMIQEEDSPKFFFGKGDYEKAREILTRIGRINGVLTPDQKYTKLFKIE